MTTLLHLNDLEALLDKLPANDRGFASDLIRQGRGPRGLSAKQWEWVGKLLERAKGEKDGQPVAAPKTFKVGTGIADVFGRGVKSLDGLTENGETIHVTEAKTVAVSTSLTVVATATASISARLTATVCLRRARLRPRVPLICFAACLSTPTR